MRSLLARGSGGSSERSIGADEAQIVEFSLRESGRVAEN